MTKSTDQKKTVVALDDKKKLPYRPPRVVKYGDIRTATLAPTDGELFESGYGDSNWMG